MAISRMLSFANLGSDFIQHGTVLVIVELERPEVGVVTGWPMRLCESIPNDAAPDLRYSPHQRPTSNLAACAAQEVMFFGL